MWYLYILLCEDQSLYAGITRDPQLRLLKHKDGKGGAYTRSHKPVKIVYLERHISKSSALKRELEIKALKRTEKIKILKLQL